MNYLRKAALLAAILAAMSPAGFAPAHAQQATPDDGAKPEYARRVDHDTVSKADESDIAAELENPIGNLTVLPFENYTNFGFGPHDGTQNIKPVVPVHLGPDWTLINRAIIAPVWNPDLSPAPSVPQAFAAVAGRGAYRCGRVQHRLWGRRLSCPASTCCGANPGHALRLAGGLGSGGRRLPTRTASKRWPYAVVRPWRLRMPAITASG